MKAFILAAGNGERLRPLTTRTPKCLVSIQNRAILAIWLELCHRHGITDVLINTHAHADVVDNFLREHKSQVHVHTTYEDTLLGSAGTLLSNRDWIGHDKEFWVFYSDVLTNTDITRMAEFHRSRGQIATLGVYDVANPKQCGIVSMDDKGIVQSFIEKPANPSSNLGFSGIMIANSSLFDLIPKQVPADLGFHVLPRLVGRMAAFPISDYLVDIGTPATYEYAQVTWPGLAG